MYVLVLRDADEVVSKMLDVTFRDKSTVSRSATGFSEELFLAEVLPLTFAYLGISTWRWTDWHLMQALVTYCVWAKITCPFSLVHSVQITSACA